MENKPVIQTKSNQTKRLAIQEKLKQVQSMEKKISEVLSEIFEINAEMRIIMGRKPNASKRCQQILL
jgi:hypothetical protein